MLDVGLVASKWRPRWASRWDCKVTPGFEAGLLPTGVCVLLPLWEGGPRRSASWASRITSCKGRQPMLPLPCCHCLIAGLPVPSGEEGWPVPFFIAAMDIVASVIITAVTSSCLRAIMLLKLFLAMLVSFVDQQFVVVPGESCVIAPETKREANQCLRQCNSQPSASSQEALEPKW